MKSSFKMVVIISIIIFLSACSKEKTDADRLEFYALRLVEGTGDYVKDEKPIFTGKDILKYDWDTHIIVFKDILLSSTKDNEIDDNDFLIGGSRILGVYYPDQFAFYLDGEELYRGVMEPQAYISFMPTGPTISDSGKGIEISNLDSNNDLRNNDKLYNFLKEYGLLR